MLGGGKGGYARPQQDQQVVFSGGSAFLETECKQWLSISAQITAGVIEVLAEALKDKNERVRRRIMATLGELLFYVATQQQVSSNSWQPALRHLAKPRTLNPEPSHLQTLLVST